MSFLDTMGKAVSSWAKHRVEDFKFWYGKAKDEFANGNPLSGIKNIAVGAADVLLQGEITDIYTEDLKPALHTQNLTDWKAKYMGNDADPSKLSNIYASMADYSSIMGEYTRAFALDNGMSECKENLKSYVKNLLNDELDETSPYITELLTSQKIKGSTDAPYYDLLKDYANTANLANGEAKTEKQNAIIEQITNVMLADTDSMIKENGVEKMETSYERSYENYSQGNIANDRYEQSIRELGIMKETATSVEKTDEVDGPTNA